MSLARRSARNFGAQLTGFIAVIADRVVLTAILLRGWGVERFSDWSTLIAAAGMLAMADLGFQTYLGNMLTRAGVRGRERSFGHLVALGMSFYAALFLLLSVGAVALTGLADVDRLLRLQTGGLAPTLFLLALHQTLRITRASFVQILRGKGENHMLVWTEVRSQLASIALAASAVSLGAHPTVAAAGFLAGELIFGFGWTLHLVRRRYGQISLRPRWPNRRERRSALAEMRWYAVFGLTSYFLLNAPVLAIAWLGLSGAPLAMFVVQRTLVNIARTVAAQLTNAFGIELARLFHQGAKHEVKQGMAMLARLNAALAGLVTVALIAFGGDVIAVWTGRRELGSMTTLLLLMLPVVAVAASTPLNLLALYAGRLKPPAAAAATQVLVALPLAVAAGKFFGIDGVAAGLAIGEIVGIAVVLPRLVATSLGVRYFDLLRTATATLAVAVGWGAPIAWLLRRAIEDASPLGLFLELAAFGLLAGLPVGFWALPAPWRSRLRGWVRAKAN